MGNDGQTSTDQLSDNCKLLSLSSFEAQRWPPPNGDGLHPSSFLLPVAMASNLQAMASPKGLHLARLELHWEI